MGMKKSSIRISGFDSPESAAWTHERSSFLDEIVVDDWLHLERMNEDTFWARVGDARILVRISGPGVCSVDVERGAYGPELGATTHYDPTSRDEPDPPG